MSSPAPELLNGVRRRIRWATSQQGRIDGTTPARGQRRLETRRPVPAVGLGLALLLGLTLWGGVARADEPPQSVKLVWDHVVKTAGGTLIPVPAHKAPTDQQVRKIEQDLINALQFYRSIGMPEPPMPTLDDQYVAFLSMVIADQANAAAFTGRLYSIESPRLPFKMAPKGETAALVLQYENYFEDADITSGRHERKGRITAVHELFHAVAWNISRPSWKTIGEPYSWVSEGLTDAIAPFSFGSQRGAWNFYRALQPGRQATGKTLGLRPYDYPLDLSEMPTQRSWLFTRAPVLRMTDAESIGKKRELYSYMTSSFWRFLMKEAYSTASGHTAQRPWRQMKTVLAEPVTAADKARSQRALAWMDRWIHTHHPVWKTQGLYGAFPAFVAHWVEFPDQWMKSRREMFKHPAWLEAVFHDGCKRVTLDEQRPTVEFDLNIRPVAATCLILKWQGESLPESGWPTLNIVANALETGDVTRRMAGLRALHLGVRGHTVGHGPVYVDRARGTAMKSWTGVAVDPLNPKATGGDAVLSFSNVAPMAVASEARTYRIRVGVELSKATGSLTRPAEPESKVPASTATPKRATRRARPTPRLTEASSDVASVIIGDLATTEALDCANATLKMGSAATGGVGYSREQEAPDAGEVMQRACAKMVEQLSDVTGMTALAANGLQIELVLPAIRSGQTGTVPGATVKAYWVDPAINVGPYSGPEVRAETENVNLVIAESNEAFVSGGFSARFDVHRHGIEGTVGGEFLIWRADTDALEFPEDPIHMMSSDALIVMASMGQDIAEIRRRALQSRAPTTEPVVAGTRPLGDACRCDCAEFGAFVAPPPASRMRCAASCGHFVTANQCVIEHEIRAGRSRTDTHAAIEACPSRCADLREGRVSMLCREALWSVYAGCSESGPITDAELREWVDWMVRELPEPHRSDLRATTLAQLRDADAETRERWVESMRQARRQQESD